jgi:hypothetical protein
MRLKHLGYKHSSYVNVGPNEEFELKTHLAIQLLKTWGNRFKVISLTQQEAEELKKHDLDYSGAEITKDEEVQQINELDKEDDFKDKFLQMKSKEQLAAIEDMDEETLKWAHENTEYTTVKRAIEAKLGE